MKEPREYVSDFLYGDAKAHERNALLWPKHYHVISAADLEDLLVRAGKGARLEAFMDAAACLRGDGDDPSRVQLAGQLEGLAKSTIKPD